MLISGIPYQTLVSIFAYHMFPYDVVYQLLGFNFCNQMFTCSIAYQILVSFITYHIFTYNIAYQLLGFEFC